MPLKTVVQEARGHPGFTTHAYGGCEEIKVSAMTSIRPEDRAPFMGFRDCPACGEALFAAEQATFACVGYIVLRWRCDACDHALQTYAEVPRGPSARAA